MPATDPDYDGPPIDLLPALKGVHPRLLFTEDDIAAMKAFYDSGSLSAVRFRSALDSYASLTAGGNAVDRVSSPTRPMASGLAFGNCPPWRCTIFSAAIRTRSTMRLKCSSYSSGKRSGSPERSCSRE